MKATQAASSFVLVVCALFYVAGAAASPGAEPAEVEAPAAEAQPACPAAAAHPGVAAGAAEEAAVSNLFEPFIVAAGEPPPSPFSFEEIGQASWHGKICVPDFCQHCNSDADCTPGNRCRAVFCP